MTDEKTIEEMAQDIYYAIQKECKRYGYWDSCDCGKDETYWRDRSIQGTLNEIAEKYGTVEVEE